MTNEKLPNILVIVIDSARADKLSCYGYEKNTTPNLDQCSKEGVRFDSAITEAPWTLPSHLSLFSGLYPSEHGLETGFDVSALALPKNIKTLPEMLANKGYATGGFSSNPWIGRLTDMHSRFDAYIEQDLSTSKGTLAADVPGHLRFFRKTRFYSRADNVSIGLGTPFPFRIDHERLSATLLKSFRDWVASNKGKPFFSFINLMNCHNPYYPPKETLKRFYGEGKPMSHARYNKMLVNHFRTGQKIDEDFGRNMHAYYDACLNHMDEQLGETFSFLRAEGLFDNTMLFIFADHGKTLTEHDRKKNPLHYITDTNLRIPMIARFPELFKPSVEKRHVQLLHVTNTILQTAGIDNSNLSGKRPTISDVMGGEGENTAYSEAYVPYSGIKDGKPDRVRSVKAGAFKLVKSEKRGFMLFNKDRDAKEEKDFSKDFPDKVVELRYILDKKASGFEWKNGKRKDEKGKLDDAIKKASLNIKI